MWKTDGSEEVSFSKLAFGFRSNCQTVLLRNGTAHSGAAGDFVQLPAFVLVWDAEEEEEEEYVKLRLPASRSNAPAPITVTR